MFLVYWVHTLFPLTSLKWLSHQKQWLEHATLLLWLEEFAEKRFLGGQLFMSSSTKMARTIDFKFCPHISYRMLNKNVPAFFLAMSHSFFISRFLKAYFAWKQLKADYSKNIRKDKLWAQFCFPFGWLHYKSVHINYWKLQFCWCRSS